MACWWFEMLAFFSFCIEFHKHFKVSLCTCNVLQKMLYLGIPMLRIILFQQWWIHHWFVILYLVSLVMNSSLRCSSVWTQWHFNICDYTVVMNSSLYEVNIILMGWTYVRVRVYYLEIKMWTVLSLREIKISNWCSYYEFFHDALVRCLVYDSLLMILHDSVDL